MTARIERAVAETLRPRAPSARWVDPGSLHLTLAFLGETAEPAALGITAALTKVASAHARFCLHVRGGGSFGPKRSPRILWASVGGELDALSALHRSVSTSLEPLGYRPDERPFSPHLTLARARGLRGDAALAPLVAHLEDDFGETTVTSLILYESILAREGARYTALATMPLAS